VSEEGAALDRLLERLKGADPATCTFIEGEISKFMAHDRRMDVHEVIRGYIAQILTLLLPGGGLVVTVILALNGAPAAAAVVGGIDMVGIVTPMWIGIRRRQIAAGN
jgi:hypothetical protein